MLFVKKFIKNIEESRYGNLIIPAVLLIVVFCFNMWFLVVRGDAYIDSDMASNFVAAVHNNSEHTILSSTWYYSTATEIMRDVNVYQLALIFIKNNWTVARALGMAIMQIALVISFLVFAKIVNIRKSSAILASAFLISPLCYWLFLMIGFGGYYNQNTTFALLTLIGVLWYTKIDNRELLRKTVCISLMVTVGIISGINGIKSVIFPYGPLVVAVILLVFISLRQNPEKIKEYNCFEWKSVKASLISLVSFVFGYLINIVYISKSFYFESKDNIAWGPFNITNIFDGISDCLALLGYQNDQHLNFLMNGRMSRTVFSLQGVANIFGLCLIAYFVLSIVRLIMRYASLSDIQKFVVVIFAGAVIVGTAIFKFTDGYETTPAYWIPVFPVMLVIMMLEYEKEEYKFNITKIILPVAMSLCVFVTSISTVNLFQESPLYANPQMVNIANWLEANGYEKGYATFWQSNVLTFLTDGKIDMWNVYGFDSLELNKWLQKMSHDEKPQGEKIFALIGPNDELDREVFLQYMSTEPGIPEIVYQDEMGYIIVEYK